MAVQFQIGLTPDTNSYAYPGDDVVAKTLEDLRVGDTAGARDTVLLAIFCVAAGLDTAAAREIIERRITPERLSQVRTTLRERAVHDLVLGTFDQDDIEDAAHMRTCLAMWRYLGHSATSEDEYAQLRDFYLRHVHAQPADKHHVLFGPHVQMMLFGYLIHDPLPPRLEESTESWALKLKSEFRTWDPYRRHLP